MVADDTNIPRIHPAPDGCIHGNFYICSGTGEDVMYLHKDGRWEESLMKFDHSWSGYYRSYEEAEKVLNKYLKR